MPLNDLEAELLEIDENLRRYDLTAWEQSQHIERREALLKKRGQRDTPGGNRKSPSHGETVKPKTAKDLAGEVGMSRATYQRRSKVGRDIAEATADILNSITDLRRATCPTARNSSSNLRSSSPTCTGSGQPYPFSAVRRSTPGYRQSSPIHAVPPPSGCARLELSRRHLRFYAPSTAVDTGRLLRVFCVSDVVLVVLVFSCLDDSWLIVFSLNLHRCHLTSSQRAALSTNVVKELELEAKERH